MTEAETATTDPDYISMLNEMLEPVEMSGDVFRFRGLLYGDIGAGKTDLAIKIAHLLGGPILDVFTDSGWTTILKYPDIRKKTTKIPFEGLKTIATILDAKDKGIEPWCSYKNLIWDTASTGVDLLLRNLVEKRKFPKDQYADDLEGRPHYRLAELKMKELVDRLNKSDLNITYIAHLRTPSEQDIKQGKLHYRPAFPEATFRVVGRMANMVGYVYTVDDTKAPMIRLRGIENIVAKCQIPNLTLPVYNVNDIPKLLEEWINEQ